MLVKFINSLIVSNNIGGFLTSEFIEELINEVDDFRKLSLVNFFGRGSKLSEDTDDWCDKRRRLVCKVFLEKGDNVVEFSFSLNEACRVRKEGFEELDRLFTSNNSFSVFFHSLVVS